ncbi:glycosyltransferase [Cryobacterium adonitolivorans]|uniref:Glycosyltransferase n=1 Tax=Cryobacterium adonitolivorans TaxID=1259189 RepID=A0A4R8VYF9_9MICO|nr:glycosyltransferase [Cryobacterium adonitolivorans]TFB96810.1 glycosyltransferase [Cryobacterium adonitolivorans]
MKILIDALGAPASSGGMRLYVDAVVRGWEEAFPDDQLTLLGGRWVDDIFGDHPRLKVVVWPNDFVGARMIGQIAVSALVMFATRSEAVISLSSLVTPFVSKRRRVCVVHDWRHVKNPLEFGAAQLAYRRLWNLSVRHAGTVVGISAKTHAETQEIVPGSHGVVVENGRDYVRFWEKVEGSTAPEEKRIITTFGHFANKRPELVLDALALLADEVGSLQLVVFGATGEYRESLRQRATDLGILDSCLFPGFVEQAEYERFIQRSSVIVLASSDEGFGLPVAEANFLGIPAVVTTDSGLAEIHHQGLVEATPDAASLAEALTYALSGHVPRADVSAVQTWADTASGLRDATARSLAARR